METKNLSFTARQLTYLILALRNYDKTLLDNEPDGWLEDSLMIEWLIKKVIEAKEL